MLLLLHKYEFSQLRYFNLVTNWEVFKSILQAKWLEKWINECRTRSDKVSSVSPKALCGEELAGTRSIRHCSSSCWKHILLSVLSVLAGSVPGSALLGAEQG